MALPTEAGNGRNENMDSKYLHKLACVRQTCTICLPVSSEASNDLKNQISGLHIDSRILLHRSSSSEAVSTADHSARPSVATTNISLDGSTLACAAPSYKEIHHAQCESMESAPITEYSSKHRDRFSADEDTSSAQHTGLLRSLTNMTPPSKFTLPFQPPPPAPRRRHTCISSMCIHSSGHQTALSRSAGSPCNKQRRQRDYRVRKGIITSRVLTTKMETTLRQHTKPTHVEKPRPQAGKKEQRASASDDGSEDQY